MQHVAPAGTPISLRDLSRWLLTGMSRRDALDSLSDAIRKRYRVQHCFFLSSGRAAMTILLDCLADLAGGRRDEVIIPSYTCYSVAASVVKAGLRVRVCDIDPATLSYDTDALKRQDLSHVLAIVSANLYGIPNDLPQLERIARDAGIYLVDDAAQCLHGSIGGRYSGTFGDAGIFSLDKGKNITSIQGGIIVSNSDKVAARVGHVLNKLPAPSAGQVLAESLKLLIYAVFLRPSLYWIPERLLKLGDTAYTTQWPVTRYSSLLAAMAKLQFDHIDNITDKRIANAAQLRSLLQHEAGIRLPAPLLGARAVYARFPILVENPQRRHVILNILRASGFGASGSYPRAIFDIHALANYLNRTASSTKCGRQVAQEVVTLPTHPYVTQRHIEEMAYWIQGTR